MKKEKNEEIWGKNKRRQKINFALQYKSVNGKIIEGKTIKEPFSSKCRSKSTNKISEDEKNLIFMDYWKLGNLSRQQKFISLHVTKIDPKHRYPKQNSNQSLNYEYNFKINGLQIQVCKIYFKNTLSITDRSIRTVRS